MQYPNESELIELKNVYDRLYYTLKEAYDRVSRVRYELDGFCINNHITNMDTYPLEDVKRITSDMIELGKKANKLLGVVITDISYMEENDG